MATGGTSDARAAEQPGGVLPRSPKVDELCRLVGRIVSADQEVVDKIGMCAELKRRRPQVPAPGRGRAKKRLVESNVRELEFYWNEMMGADQSAVSFCEFAAHVEMSHSGRNIIAHCSVISKENVVKNFERRRAFDKNDLRRQLWRTWLALRDTNKIYRHIGLGDYGGYLDAIRAK